MKRKQTIFAFFFAISCKTTPIATTTESQWQNYDQTVAEQEFKEADAKYQKKEEEKKEWEMDHPKVEFKEPPIVPVGKTVAFMKVIFKLPLGKIVGIDYNYISGVTTKRVWESGTTLGDNIFDEAATDELKKHKYNVYGEMKTIFDDDKTAKAQYFIGGTITDMKYDTYIKPDGEYSESSISVDWQLYSNQSKKIVYQYSSKGNSKSKQVTITTLTSAFRDAFNKFIEREEFKSHIMTVEETKKEMRDKITIPIKKKIKKQVMPRDYDTISRGIIILEVGATHGTGFIISESGYALTAAHVVAEEKVIKAILMGGISIFADTVTTDEESDTAIIKLRGEKFPIVELEVEKNIKVGTEIYAAGTPLNADNGISLTKGIVSGLEKGEQFECIQIDAAISPGYSGGPIINKRGRAIGIISRKIVSESVEGISFSIPIEIALERLNIEMVR